MTHIFTREETLAALKEAVAERGEDYTYKTDPLSFSEACSYSTVAGESSCVVGNVFKRLVPDIFESIHEYEWYNEEDGKFDLHEQSLHRFMKIGYKQEVEIPFEVDAITLLKTAQFEQDYGTSWGESLRRATQGEAMVSPSK